jgi:hypothetical protein
MTRKGAAADRWLSEYDHKFFMQEVKKGTQEAAYADQHFPEFVRGLSDLIAEYTGRSQAAIPERYRLGPIPARKAVQRTAFVAAYVHRCLSEKIELFHRQYFAMAAHHITNLLGLIKQKRQRGISVHCSVEQVQNYFMSTYQVRSPVALLRRLLSLKAYVIRRMQTPRVVEIAVSELEVSLRTSALQVISTIDFSPFCPFDDHFALYVLRSGSARRFDEIVDRVGAGGKTIDPGPINEIISNSCQLVKPKTPAEVAVIKNAVYRFLFDRLYVKYPRLISGDGADCAQLGQICDRIRWLTPREMGIPAKMLKAGMVDIAFASLVQRSPLLQKAVSELSGVQFLTNPVDIIAHVFLSLKSGEEFVRQNSFESRFGQFVSMFDPSKVANVSDQLSFDDFFPMFCLIFSLAWPVNASAIIRLTARFRGVGLPPSFDFASLFFTSVMQYVKTAKPAQISKEASVDVVAEEDEDPLGLSRLVPKEPKNE